MLFALLLLLCACERAPQDKKPTPEPLPKNVITFVTINSPNTYYINNDKELAGFEYDLAKLFTEYLNDGTQARFLVVDSTEKVIEALKNKQADIAAADLTITDQRKLQIDFSIPYQEVQQQVVYNQDVQKKPAKNINALIGQHIAVPAATSFAERLTQLQEKEPGLMWEARSDMHSEKLLEEVADGYLDYTVADNHLVSIIQNFHPNLGVAFALGKPENIAWGFTKNAKPELLKKANAFFAQIKKNGALNHLIDRYHGNATRLKPVDVKAYLLRIRTLLPKYTRLFKQAQEITGIDWRLLAAVSYQESHWDTFNTSPTNVRGLMMLTEDTADRMGVSDRLDPKQSIPAGAKYISQMIDTIPDRVPEPDRSFLALAAYNIGYAHVEDARVLAQRLKLDPDRWSDVKKTLILLNDPKYYTTVKYGYCSGGAPVIFVESIRSYYNILSRMEPAHEPLDSFKVASNSDMAGY